MAPSPCSHHIPKHLPHVQAQQKPFNSADLLQLLPPLPRPRQQPHPDPSWRQQSQPEQPPQASIPQQSQPAAGKGSLQAAANGAAQHAAGGPPFSAAQNAVGAAQGQLGLASTHNVIQGQQLKGMQHEQVPRQPSEPPEADQPAVAPSATMATSPGVFAGAGCSPVAAPEAVSADSPQSLPAAAKPLSQTELEASAEVDPTCTDVENGEIRVCLKRAMAAAPAGNTVATAHKLPSLDGGSVGGWMLPICLPGWRGCMQYAAKSSLQASVVVAVRH